MTARYVPDGGTGAAATTNALSAQGAGIAQSIVADLGRSPASAGIALAPAPATLLVPQSAGIALGQRVSGTVAQAAHSAGVGVSVVTSGGPVPAQSGGVELVQITYDLTHTGYATGWPVTGGSWTNQNNGLGANDGVFATNKNTATVAASGSLEYAFAAQPNRTDLTISSVTLTLYWKNVAGAISPCTYTVALSKDNGSNYSNLGTGAGSIDWSAGQAINGTTFFAGSWANIAACRVKWTYTGPASASASTLSVDAMKLTVVASRTDTL